MHYISCFHDSYLSLNFAEGDAPPSPPPPHKGYPEDIGDHAAQAIVATGTRKKISLSIPE